MVIGDIFELKPKNCAHQYEASNIRNGPNMGHFQHSSMVNAAMSTLSVVVCEHTVVVAGESGSSTEGANAQA
jgi:hypothetical protein